MATPKHTWIITITHIAGLWRFAIFTMPLHHCGIIDEIDLSGIINGIWSGPGLHFSRTQVNLAEGMRHQFAMNPVFHKTILRKPLTLDYVDLRENKSTKQDSFWRSLIKKSVPTLHDMISGNTVTELACCGVAHNIDLTWCCRCLSGISRARDRNS